MTDQKCIITYLQSCARSHKSYATQTDITPDNSNTEVEEKDVTDDASVMAAVAADNAWSA